MIVVNQWKSRSKTFYEVFSEDTQHGHRVYVDRDAHWYCSCQGAKIRGNCKHINALRMSKEWRHMRIGLGWHEYTYLTEAVFMKLMELPRFVMQPSFGGRRHFVAFGVDVFVDDQPRKIYKTRGADKIAGSVLEVSEDGLGGLYATDCLFFRGDDYRNISLRNRLMRLSDVMELWKSPIVDEADLVIDVPTKFRRFAETGGLMTLKDLGSKYDYRPRNWLRLQA